MVHTSRHQSSEQREVRLDLHFDSKAAVTAYLRESHPELAARTSFLYCGPYLHNWCQNPALRPTKKSDGVYTMTMPKVFEEYVVPFADPARDTVIFVQALLDAPAGSSMLGSCTRLSYGDLWRLWARIESVELNILEGDFDFGDGMPEWLQWQFRNDFWFTATYGYVGGDAQVKGPEEFGVAVSKLTDAEEWIREEDYNSLL